MEKIPGYLRGYSPWLPPDWRIIVLVDEDRGDCKALKEALEEAAGLAGLTTGRSPGTGKFQVLNRIAVEELESWFFGDPSAITAAYPGVPPTLGARQQFRKPDEIKGGTWEALERVLQQAGYYAAGMPKIEAARKISAQMEVGRNKSPSFKTFIDGVLRLRN